MSKEIIIIAGTNRAGKTTFARSFLPDAAQCPRFINAGLIAAGLSPFAPEAAVIKAARLMRGETADCVLMDRPGMLSLFRANGVTLPASAAEPLPS